MLDVADEVLIGGAMCFPFLKAQGHEVGTSLVEAGTEQVAADVLGAAAAAPGRFVLPHDIVVAAEAVAGASTDTVPADAMPAGKMGLDIGSLTARDYAARIAAAGTVFWNGPMGLFEVDDFAAGTRAVAEAIAGCRGAVSVVGGGDTVSAVRRFGARGPHHPRLDRRRGLDGVPRGQGPAGRRRAPGQGGGMNAARRPLMAGNWKMYKTPAETAAFFAAFLPLGRRR